ncbi:MAG: hypothetical protein WCP19_03775 [Chloroflexota bacterium]
MALNGPQDTAAEAIKVYQSGDFLKAAQLFGQAAENYKSNGNLLDEAEMKNNQSVAYLQAGDAQNSYSAAAGTAAVFFKGGDFRRQGMALGNEAAALAALNRFDEASESYRSAAAALETAGEDQLRATVMQALAGIQLRKGKIMDALLTMRMGLSGVKEPSLKQKILLNLLKIRSS